MPEKFLLVDDNVDFIDNIKDVLEEEGFLVETANSGEEAITLIEGSNFSLVLMDIKMPGMNGVECFLKMKAQNPQVKVILFTAYALNDLIQTAQENGVWAVLKKPLDMPSFIDIIKEAQKTPHGGTILVADDDRDLCDNLREVLTAGGFRVALAFDGYEAVHEAEKQIFDILLLDLKIPEINGLEVYRRIKPLQPNLVTILITGYAEEMKDHIKQAISENAYTFMTKPLDMKYLLNLIHEVSEARENGTLKKTTL